MHARSAVQAFDLDPRVLAERPPLRIADAATELRFDARILVVRRAVLRRKLVRIEHVDRPTGEQTLQLARLVLVARGERCSYSPLQRTSATCSTSAMRATTRAGLRSGGSRTSSASRRRS